MERELHKYTTHDRSKRKPDGSIPEVVKYYYAYKTYHKLPAETKEKIREMLASGIRIKFICESLKVEPWQCYALAKQVKVGSNVQIPEHSAKNTPPEPATPPVELHGK